MPDRAHLRLAAVALAVASCSLLPAGATVVTLHSADGADDLAVALYDPDGLVQAVEAAQPDEAGVDESLKRVDEATARLQWLGGACDHRTQINVHVQDETISLGLRTDGGGSCISLGVPRAVTIRFAEPFGERTLEWPDAGLTATSGPAGRG